MKKFISALVIFMTFVSAYAQDVCVLSGRITDKNTGLPVAGASVSLLNTNIGVLTDEEGFFNFCHIGYKEYILLIERIGYNDERVGADLTKGNTTLDITLIPADIELHEIEISGGRMPVMREREELADAPAHSFLKQLSLLPGVSLMRIGAGMEKPVIRGFSANRVSVINRGIVQQNQQWGSDHGIDIDPSDISNTRIYKGAFALSLAAGGTTAIEIIPNGFSNRGDYIHSEALLSGASNNDLINGTYIFELQKGRWFARGSYNYQDYGDYRVPASDFDNEGESVELPDKRVTNTAGRIQSLSGTIGFRNNRITSYLNVANRYQKTGLFELHDHDHGHEHDHDESGHIHEDETADTSHRNIGLPYARSNHFSVTNNTEWKKDSSLRLLVNTGYQFNYRKEFESFHEHYEGQPTPATNNDLAVDFKLRTYSTNARLYLDEDKRWTKVIGANVEYMQNRIGGFEYFLPRYNQVSGGVSFVNTYRYQDNLSFEGGLRYDMNHLDITGFYDNYMASYLQQGGYPQSVVDAYAQRGYEVNRNIGSWSGNLGLSYNPTNSTELRFNISKSFRSPSANELAANGLHHAAYRYEIGNPDLKAEEGYTFDMGFEYNMSSDKGYDKLNIAVNPFLTYYDNFIYLQQIENPEVLLYESQPYKYMQAKAIYGGGEYNISWRMIKEVQISSSGSFVINKNLDDHQPLPFTPPFTMRNEIKYMKDFSRKKLSYFQLSFSHLLYARQSRVGVGEEETPGTNLFNISTGFDYNFSPKWKIMVNVQLENVFNTRYMNHLSLYRRLNLPEQGRNLKLFVRIPFNSSL